MEKRVRMLTAGVWLAACAEAARAAAIVATGPYAVDPIYRSQVVDIGPVGVVTPGATLAAVAGNQVVTVGLPGHGASPALFTLPPTVGGAAAFPGGFAVSNGTYILTGQTGAYTGTTFAGEAYLTLVGGGATNTRPVNGIFDATPRGGSFVVSAAHGPDDHGNTTASYAGPFGSYVGNGIYALELTGAAISGLDLLFDTGAYSGAVAGDAVSGDLYFALGGDSATLAGAPHGYNDIWVLKAGDIAAAAGGGVIGPAVVDYVASIGTGFNDGISGMAFDPAGRLLVGLTDFTAVGIDRIVAFDVNRSNAGDYLSTFAGTVAEGTGSGVRMFDFALDGNVLRISAVPEPATGVVFAVVGLAAWRRRRAVHEH